jgi:signal transduction histidine kinase
MRIILFIGFLFVVHSSAWTQKRFEKDTAFLNIEKQSNDTNKFYAFFYKSLNLSVNDLEFSGFLAQKSYELAKKIKFPKGIAMACDILGNFSMQTGDYKTSYKWMSEAIKQKEKLKDDFGSAVSCNQLTKLLRLMGNYKLALPNAFKTLSITNKIGIPKFKALALNAIANVYYDLKELDSAAKYYENVIVFYDKGKDSSAYALALTNLGTIAKDKGETEKTIQYNAKALKFIQGQNDNRLELLIYSNLASAYLKIDDLIQAGIMFDKAKVILKAYGEADQQQDFYEQYATYLFKIGKYKEAFEASEKHQVLKDSLRNVEVNSNIADLETKYQTEKKEQENKLLKQKREIDQLTIADSNRRSFMLTILLSSVFVVLIVLIFFFVNRIKTSKKLQAQNEQINKQNNTLKELNSQLIESEEELQSANEAKGQLLSIISHDISSPIKALYNYEEALLENAKAFKTVDDFTDALAKLHKSTGDVYTMSNNLLDYAQTQQEGFVAEITEIKLGVMVADMLKLLDQHITRKKIIVQNAIDQSVRINSDQNLLYILLRNIVSNAVKFSPEGKSLRIEWKNDEHKILISDEGEGMDKQKIKAILEGNNFHSSMGTQGEKGTGLGMKIAFNCAQKLNATIDIQSVSGKGTTFGIQL